MKTPFFFFLNNTRFTVLALVATFALGFFAILTSDVESNPEINQPIGIVQTFYPNSSPSDVESQITKPLEKEISGLRQLKEISSTSDSNVSFITATFESKADTEKVLNSLREAVNKAASALPSEANTPQVIELDFNGQSIVTLSLTGEASKKELTKLAEIIEERIKRISGVSKVEITGQVEDLVKIELDGVKLESYGLNVGTVISAINSSNLNAPLGSINRNSEEVGLRLIGKAEQLGSIKNLPISNLGGVGGQSINLITLQNIAEVNLAPEVEKTQSFVSDNLSPAQNSVTLNVFKSKGGNIINIVNEIDKQIEIMNQELPDQIKIVKTNDNAYFIKADLASLTRNGLQTIVIIFLALLVFLATREALVAAICVPLVFLMTFAILMLLGQTINGLTIFSLILSLGLIVDTSIVIIEGIHENKNQGLNNTEAAKKSLATFKWPLIGGTLTTISAFLPMLLVGGVVGEFIKTIPIVLSITLFSSLFVSFAFTPFVSTLILRKDDYKSGFMHKKEAIIQKLQTTYRSFLHKVLRKKLLSRSIVGLTLLAFFASLSLPFTGLLKAQLFPVTDAPFVFINIEAPVGTDLKTTATMSTEVEKILNKESAIANYVLNVGSKIDVSGFIGNNTVKPHFANVVVNLKDLSEREESSFEISSRLRAEFDKLPGGLTVSVEDISAGPPTAPAFGAKIIGPDLEKLKQYSIDFKNSLSQIDGIVNIATGFDNPTEEVYIKFNQDILAYYGLSNQQIALILQSYTNGVDAGKVELEGEEYDIKVFLGHDGTKDVRDLNSISIPTQVGNIPLSYLGEINSREAIQAIPRINQERSVQITADTDKGVLISQLQEQIQKAITDTQLESGYTISLGGEDADIQESFKDLFSSMFVAVLLILVILVLQFNSFRQTFMILFSIPLAVIGIFPGLALLGLPLSFPAFLGIVMLCGIVVNDTIVMVTQINKLRADGMPVLEALEEGATSRLVPIMLTSITTIFGLMSITLADAFWRGLGTSVMFGLATATFLMLVIIPIFYGRLYK